MRALRWLDVAIPTALVRLWVQPVCDLVDATARLIERATHRRTKP